MTRRHWLVALVGLVGFVTACFPSGPPPPPPPPPLEVPCTPSAGSPVASNDPLRSGWYPDEPGLSPASGSGCTFGQLFSAPVNGQVYAQPVVDPGTGRLVVGTETNWIYGLDPATGAQQWGRNLHVPWKASDLGCPDLAPNVGITSTPAIDSASHTAYFFAKTYASGTSGPAAWYAHAVDTSNGNERPGFPVLIQGVAANDASTPFEATTMVQRPGLLLMNGVVYAAFGGLCDTPDYRGWVVGVTTAGAISTIWSAEAGQPGSPGAGIWQSGGRLVSDQPGEILLSSGNGNSATTPTPGTSPPPTLGSSTVRLVVQQDGSLEAVDFFTPFNAEDLNANDADYGTGAPLVLPSNSFGTPSHPKLAVQVSKSGVIYVLDRDNLGGFAQGPDGRDAVVSTAASTAGIWASPALWPGDGGNVYVPAGTVASIFPGFLNAYRVVLDGNGEPSLSLVGRSDDTFGFGSSSAIVTSDGTNSASALVWVIWMADGSGQGAQLRAYNTVPDGEILQLRGSWPIGQASKFNTPTISAGRMYVGARDGHVLAFAALPSTSSQSPPTTVGSTTTTAGVTTTGAPTTTVPETTSPSTTSSTAPPSSTRP